MESFQEQVQLLLKSQYLHLEDYINSQTRLRNILRQQTPSDAISSPLLANHEGRQQQVAVLAVYDTTEQVRKDLQQLSEFVNRLSKNENNNDNERLRMALQIHLECSQRVVTTCYNCGNQWHTLGIHVSYDQNNATEIQLTALATLKASITQLREHLD